MDRNLRKLPKRGEGWNAEAAGGERLPKSAVKLAMHPGGCIYGILKGIEDGQVFRAHVERDEVPSPVVPWVTSGGEDGESGVPAWGEVVRAGPPRGSLS